MSDARDNMKRKMMGWVQGALTKVETALVTEKPKAPPAPAPVRTATGSLGTGGLEKPRPENRANTGAFKNGTDTLVQAARPQAAARAQASTAPPRNEEEEAAESKKRLAFISGFIKDPEGHPSFKDKRLVYRILTEERAYQQHRIAALQNELKALQPSAADMGLTPEEAAENPIYDGLEARREDLQEQLKKAQSRQSQIFAVLKKVTGVRGKTGGTGFLAPPPEPGAEPDDASALQAPWEQADGADTFNADDYL